MQNNFFQSVYLSFLALISLFVGGCNQEKPDSYEIPKEKREVKAPAIVENENSPVKMPILPGMREAAEKSGSVSYKVPDSWEEFASIGIRKANFKVIENTGSAEITVLTFPGDVGGQLANINRWRGEIGLYVSAPEGIANDTENLEIDGHQGLYVRLEGETRSTLGVILPLNDNTWFFKMTGDTNVVFANEPKMKQFLDSFKFEEHDHKEE